MILENLYISPLEACNLNCRSCYTTKTRNILSNDQILGFVSRFQNYLKNESLSLKSITFCGGEVFTLPEFPSLINSLIDQDIFITIITNGTIDRLDQIKKPHNCQLLVSFDGPKEVHDLNRGTGNFDKSHKFVEHALALNFPVEIFYLITKESYPHKDSFDIFGLPKTYLTDRLGSLTLAQIIDIKRHYPTYPSKDFGCSVISLQSDGLIYGCCETSRSIGTINDDSSQIVDNFVKSLTPCTKCPISRINFGGAKETKSKLCLGCCDPEYLCGYKKELMLQSCQEVVNILK
jgi:sulfatase maturation enzyme AslB (radical SAM superfamily)